MGSRDISTVIERKQANGGHGLPDNISAELSEIIKARWGGSLPRLAEEVFGKERNGKSKGYYTVYSILVQGGGKASLELIEKLADGLGSSKNEVAEALKKKTPESRKKALLDLCEKYDISITALSVACFNHKSHIYSVINSNKRTQNFLKLVDAFELDIERFEQHYKQTVFAA